MQIPDPIEQLNSRIEKHIDNFIDENTCMTCGKTVNYELLCVSPIGDGPAVCAECAGVDN